MALSYRKQQIIEILQKDPNISISEIKENLQADITQVTINRDLAILVREGFIEKKGKGRAIRYVVSRNFALFSPVDIDSYFNKEIHERKAEKEFNPSIFQIITESEIFSHEEQTLLNHLQKKYTENISKINPSIYNKELERLTIDLSWKSSQIEGNTYSLLETEQLLVQKIEATDKSKEEAIMLLNHKKTLQHIIKNKNLYSFINVPKIIDIHKILIDGLNVDEGLRQLPVGITGTIYSPPDDYFKVKEAIDSTCNLINSKNNNFEKAILSILLTSYIQPFNDGNKRSGRMIGNALLLESSNCPLSYRSVDPLEYKKAMLLFYEQNNLSAFKELFIQQYKFAVNNYFLA